MFKLRDIDFKYDAREESIHTSVEMKRSHFILDGEGNAIDVPLPATIPQTSIVTPSHFYYYQPTLNFTDFKDVPAIRGRVGPVAFREPVELAEKQRSSTVVDPRDLFAYRT